MARVTDAEVRELIPSTSIADLTPFIAAASILVDQLELGCGSSFSLAKLKEIERWLSAHFASISDPKLNMSSEKFEDAENKYNRGSSSDMSGVMSTTYGQMANTLSNGCLIDLDKPRATFLTASSV